MLNNQRVYELIYILYMHIIEIFLKCVLFYIPFIRLILPGKWETHGVLL